MEHPFAVSSYFSSFFLILLSLNVLVAFKLHKTSATESISKGQCFLDRNFPKVTIDDPKLSGRWVSTSCEILPGPKYVVRDFLFYPTGSFLLHHYFYQDFHCSKPDMAFLSVGRISYVTPTLMVPGGLEMGINLHRVEAIPYSTLASDRLTKSLRSTCFVERKRFQWPQFKPYHQVQVRWRFSIALRWRHFSIVLQHMYSPQGPRMVVGTLSSKFSLTRHRNLHEIGVEYF